MAGWLPMMNQGWDARSICNHYLYESKTIKLIVNNQFNHVLVGFGKHPGVF
jgi:hypothetical protein